MLDDAQADAVTLWVAHTHVFDAFGCTPYLAIASAEKRSGKTRLLEVLELLVREPLPTANISDAALFRVIDERQPTLLIDEVDAIFGKKSAARASSAGSSTPATAAARPPIAWAARTTRRCRRSRSTARRRSPASATACPDTISDRSIPIRLKRRTRDESVERFRLREVEPEGHELRDRLADWLEPQHDQLVDSRPELPDELDDRAQDVWEPLLAIADLRMSWAERARAAAIALSTGEERQDDSITALLIRDIHRCSRRTTTSR